ncbi:MAG: FkbM family methyltransferase [Spirochaetaceae bacterium]|jgi:hypothetical protein|nr:FkbM family methyltransferase [Spirochaetaceae bacterium]
MTVIRIIKLAVRWFIPFGIMEYRKRKKKKKNAALQLENDKLQLEKEHKIRKYFQNLNHKNVDSELLEIIEYFDNNPFSIFPYDFVKKYNSVDIDVFFDETAKMKYILHDNKRMYFPRDWAAARIRAYYTGLRIEQDIDSPHRYETPEYTVKNGDVIADIGAAEGIWALTYVEKAEKIFLFECEDEWINALKKTFEPWQEKVIIVNKYISNITQDKYITFDDFINGGKINFIKADIEGMELELLKGCVRTLIEATDLKLLLCAYHHQDDAEKLRSFLEAKQFSVENTKRYMLFIGDKEFDIPYIRRGLLRAKKLDCFASNCNPLSLLEIDITTFFFSCQWQLLLEDCQFFKYTDTIK